MDNFSVLYREASVPDIDVTNTDWNIKKLSNHNRDALIFTFQNAVNFVSIECYAEINVSDPQPVCADIDAYDTANTKIVTFKGDLWQSPGLHSLTFTIGRASKEISRVECRAGGGESGFASYCKLMYNGINHGVQVPQDFHIVAG